MYINKFNLYNTFFIIIVIKERDSILKDMKDKTIKVWNSKLYLKSKILFKKSKFIAKNKDDYKIKKNPYILNNDLDDFENNKIYITSFLKILWEYPESIYEIIKHSGPILLKNNLAPFIINNFYTDYTSGNYVDNNLLYVITLLIKNEFETMDKNKELENTKKLELYLENTNLGFFLDAIGQIPDVQNFFKEVIVNSVEKLARSNVLEEEIRIDTDEMSTKKGKKKKEQETNNENNFHQFNYMKRRNKNNQIFEEKYSKDIKLENIVEKIEIAKKEKKDDVCIFFMQLEQELKKSQNEDLFSNKILMNSFTQSNKPTFILSFYQNEFLKGIDFIEQLIIDFENNIHLMPKIIKSICLIISKIIKNKYRNISKIKENIIISKFLLDKLLVYFLSSPNYNALIHNYVISESTIKNIQGFIVILKKLFSGKLFKNNYEECNYTPYNWLILDKFENIFNIVENSKTVKLPNFIENLIDNKLPVDYNYDYFIENKDKIFTNISICFTLDNILALIKGIKNIENFFRNDDNNDKKFKLKKSLDKVEYKENMSEIKNVFEERIEKYLKEMKEKNIKIDNNNLENYYILNTEIIDKKYEKLFSLNNKKITYFNIDLKDRKQLTENEINIINLKNSICGVLSLYRSLDIYDYSLSETSSFLEIFSEIKKYINLPNFTLIKDNKINICNWYINAIFDYINKIPDEYKENNYEKLLYELEQDVISSINEINFGKISLIRNKLILVNKALDYYEEKGKDIKDIILNENIRIVTEGISVLVDIKFMYDEQEKYFYLSKSPPKNGHFEGDIKFNKKNNCYTIKTVKTFTNFFPNLSEYNFSMDISPLEIIKELNINTKLKEYFEMIKKTLTSHLNIDNNQYNELYQEKIVNYVMDKIYDKIYPPIPDSLDSKLMNNMKLIPKNELDNLVNKDYNLDNLIPDVTALFQKIYYARTPLLKLKCLKNILEYITNILSFKKGSKNSSIGADDIVPVLNYFFANAKPYKIITDLEFIKTFKSLLPVCENDIVIFESITTKILNYNNES